MCPPYESGGSLNVAFGRYKRVHVAGALAQVLVTEPWNGWE